MHHDPQLESVVFALLLRVPQRRPFAASLALAAIAVAVAAYTGQGWPVAVQLVLRVRPRNREHRTEE